MAKKVAPVSVFEQIKTGLEDCLAHAKGELTLVTTRIPTPPPKTNPDEIAALRRDLHMSQSVFAATLNVSAKTVQSWEQGLREPNEASLRLLQIIKTQPSVVEAIFYESPAFNTGLDTAGIAQPRSTSKAHGRTEPVQQKKAIKAI